MLPSIAFVALDRVAIVVREAADAANAVVPWVAIDWRCVRVVSLWMRRRVKESLVARVVVTVDRLDRERGVCHAISSQGERVQVR